MSEIAKHIRRVYLQPVRPHAMLANRDFVIIVIVTLLALLQRFITMGRIDHGVSSDEFYYAVNALGITNILRGASVLEMKDVYLMHPLVSYPIGVLGLLVQTDALVLGRYLQLSLNALSIPLTYILARNIGFGRSLSIVAAVNLSILRGYWEGASHFWPDSQFTLLLMSSCILFATILRKEDSGRWHVLISAGFLILSTLTREHTPLILILPFGFLFTNRMFSGELSRGKGTRIAVSHIGAILISYTLMTTGIFFPRSDNVAVALRTVPTDGPDIIMQRTQAMQGTPSFLVSSMTHLRFDFERLHYGLGEGVGYIFLIFAAVGMMSCLEIVYSKHSNDAQRPATPFRRLECVVGTIVFILSFCLLASVLFSNLSIDFAWLIAVGILYIVQYLLREQWWTSGNRSIVTRSACRKSISGAEITYYGLVIVAVAIVNMSFDSVISSTARFYFPIFPMIAVFGAYGMLSIARSGILALFAFLYVITILYDGSGVQVDIPTHKVMLGLLALSHYICIKIWISRNGELSRWKLYALPSIMLLLILATPLSNLVRYSYLSAGYIGYPEDQYYSRIHSGIRWRILNEMRPWLLEHIDAEDHVLSHQAHYIAWAADTGLIGLYNSTYMPKEPWDLSVFLSENDLSKLNVDYIIQLNPYLHVYADPEQYEAWVDIYHGLEERDDMLKVFHQESAEGKLESYVFKKVEL